MEKLLPLTYHPEKFVVQDQYFHFGAELHDGSQFLQSHLETSVSDNGYNRLVWCAVPGANCCREPKAHRSETS